MFFSMDLNSIRSRAAGALLAFLFVVLAGDVFALPGMEGIRGNLGIHDPSTIVKHKGRYYIFGTGAGIVSKSSADGIVWNSGPTVFAIAPAWVTTAAPGFNGDFWAPDIFYLNGKWCLYYSVSSWGSQQSAIGLATNPTLDPADANYSWTDQGIVIQSVVGSAYNTIDPSVTFDAGGNPWLAFGSYWNGIYLVQLDPQTGKRIATNSPVTQLAYNGSIEANCLYRRGGYYYLFVNWGSCCSGVNSTYNIRVGRSTSITGPYLDRNGVDLRTPGGTSFLDANGKFAGPGHLGILNENGQRWISYHYYDAGDWSSGYGAYGAADFDLAPLSWTADDWPVFSREWSAIYNFDTDARDENNQYYGLLEGGASIQSDALRGRVLNLNGTNQSVRLPAGVANARTFAAVIKWNGGAAWQRIFDFGVDTTDYVMLTPSSSAGRLRCDLRVNSATQSVEWTSGIPAGVWTHVALTLDGSRGVLYVNGNPVATNASMTFSPLQVRAQTNHLGHSKFTADPDFNGQISSFRVCGRALAAAEIAAPLPVIAQPRDNASYWPGQALAFSGGVTDFNDLPLAASTLTWRVEYVQDGQTNLVSGPLSGVTNGVFNIPTNATGGGVYRVLLTATNTSGRFRTVTASLAPANPPPAWSAYYPFRADATDANGHFNGTLNGGATIQSDVTRGSVLNLSGANQYVSLPPAAGNILTFTAWVKWNGGAAWQRILDFGNDTTRYCVLTPAAANGKLRFNITVNGTGGEQIIDAPDALPTGVWTHVAVVVDGSRGVLYTNGVAVATNSVLNLVPADLNATNIWFGRSQWPDPYFDGQLSSVRMWARPLSAEEIVAPLPVVAKPSHGAIYRPGEIISFNGSATDFYDTSLAATSLVWTVQWRSNTTVTTMLGPLSGITNGSFLTASSGGAASNGYYRIQLVATDSAARKATNFVDIFPAASVVPNWASFYPFTSGATDASNRFNGTLAGGATIVSDPARGNVMNLSGSSQYLNLPGGVGSLNTFAAWVKWNGGNAWQRIFDFGPDTSRWLFLTPKDGSGRMQSAITTDSAHYNRVLQSAAVLPTNEWTHVAVMFDGHQGVIYTNGQPAAINNSVNLLPSDVGATKAFLGKSQYSADAYFNGRMDSVKLNSRSLSLAELTAPTPVITAPGAGTLFAGGDTILFAGRALDYADAPLPASTLSWTAEFRHDGVADAALGTWSGVTNGSFVATTAAPLSTNLQFRVSLTVTDTNGNRQMVSTDVQPRLSQLSLQTVPAGLQLQVDGQTFTGPTSLVAVAGMARTVNAPSPQAAAGSNYSLVLWSDGGAATHGITFPYSDSELTASFVAPTLNLDGGGSGLALSWPGWATNLGLYFSTNLMPPVSWTVVTNPPVLSNGKPVLVWPAGGAQGFFRLQAP